MVRWLFGSHGFDCREGDVTLLEGLSPIPLRQRQAAGRRGGCDDHLTGMDWCDDNKRLGTMCDGMN
ncbi:cobalt ABC transporter ATP-binding protein [Sesbania bispinosa]|nr:cobalt ABC transporter ATP-binding protein [Sesbania bispinosa]